MAEEAPTGEKGALSSLMVASDAAAHETMIGGSATITNGEDSNDECCICGDEWAEGHEGWVLCDTHGCENTVCPKCTSTLSLSVSELFYCPLCSGSGQSAAATAGGAVATAVAACTALEKLPLSFNAVQKILSNLLHNPDEPKYRKLRLENRYVKELCDLEPVLNILTSVGFVRTHCARQNKKKNTKADLPPTEEVLLLEGTLGTHVNELLQILNGLSPPGENTDKKRDGEDKNDTSSSTTEVKRAVEEDEPNKKKQKADDA